MYWLEWGNEDRSEGDEKDSKKFSDGEKEVRVSWDAEQLRWSDILPKFSIQNNMNTKYTERRVYENKYFFSQTLIPMYM